MDNSYFTILGHPTGRLIHRRAPYALDLEAIVNAARERNCFLEVNAQPERLDLSDIYCRMAKDLGVKVAISSDAHSIAQLSFMKFGVFQARRGWLEKDDVINTRKLSALKKLLKRA
jgi:DNA polymerase (family 10)